MPRKPRAAPPDEIRTADRLSVERFGVPEQLLMERAALSILTFILERFWDDARRGIRVLAGKGGNGGDGFATARLAWSQGFPCELLLAFSRQLPRPAIPPASEIDRELVQRLSDVDVALRVQSQTATRDRLLEPRRFEGLWLDCILGSGFRGPLRPELLELVRLLNDRHDRLRERVVAVDVPSGLDATTGEPSPDAVHADATITLGLDKPALASARARSFVGAELRVGDVGWPTRVLDLISE